MSIIIAPSIHSFKLLTSVVDFNLSLATFDNGGEDLSILYENSSLLGH
jgi:hypothetical protein